MEDERREDQHQHLNHKQFVALIKTTNFMAGINSAILKLLIPIIWGLLSIIRQTMSSTVGFCF